MFSRIRYAAHVLTYSPKADPYTQPDIIFQEDRPSEVSKISHAISNLIGVLGVALSFGFLSAFTLKRLPLTKSSVAVGVLAIVFAQAWHFFSQKIQDRIHSVFRIGERMGPYFGNKLTKAVRILRS